MNYEAQLTFFCQLLKDMNISSCILSNPSESIPPDIDLRLRSSLFQLDNYASFLQNSMSQAQEKTLYRFFSWIPAHFSHLSSFSFRRLTINAVNLPMPVLPLPHT